MLFFTFLVLLALVFFVFTQYQKTCQANELYSKANALEQEDIKEPYDLIKLKQALALYKRCKKLSNKPKYFQSIQQCQKKIEDRYGFLLLLEDGRKKS